MCPLGTGSAATEGPHPGGCVASAAPRGLCSRPDLRLLFHALVAVCHFCVYSLVSLLLRQRVSVSCCHKQCCDGCPVHRSFACVTLSNKLLNAGRQARGGGACNLTAAPPSERPTVLVSTPSTAQDKYKVVSFSCGDNNFTKTVQPVTKQQWLTSPREQGDQDQSWYIIETKMSIFQRKRNCETCKETEECDPHTGGSRRAKLWCDGKQVTGLTGPQRRKCMDKASSGRRYETNPG